MLLNILQHTGQSPWIKNSIPHSQQRILWPQVSVMSGLRSPELDVLMLQYKKCVYFLDKDELLNFL